MSWLRKTLTESQQKELLHLLRIVSDTFEEKKYLRRKKGK